MNEFILEDYLRELSAAESIDDCPKVPIPDFQRNQNYLFISYSHRDYKAVYSDLAHLYSRGVRFWYDKGLSVGREWEQEVEEHIKNPNCCGIIFYVSTSMFLSESVLKEIEFTRKRKKGNIIYQKNYFCVNLHQGSISKILNDAQNILTSKGEPLLNTKVVNTLTATFSDSATYINAGSRFHLDELVDQIQRQFDVTTKMDNSPAQSIFHSVDTSDAALRAIWRGKIEFIPLCQYVSACYRENKTNRPWYLIPVTTVIGFLMMIFTWYRVFTMPDTPYVQYVLEHYSPTVIISLGILVCSILWLYGVMTLFWLYFLSPVYQKKTRVKFENYFFFLFMSLLTAFSIPLGYIVLLFMVGLLIEVAQKADAYVPK